MQLLTTFILLFQAISSSLTLEVTQNLPKYNERSAFGVTTCYDNKATVIIWQKANIQTLLHEFAHVYDCIDNGNMDGSPLNLCSPSLECGEIYATHVEYTYEYR